MALLFSDPFERLFHLQRNLDAFRSSDWLGRGISSGGAFPPINVFGQGDDFVAIAELPGIRREDVDIKVKGRQIRISGNKAVSYGEGASLHRRERRSGHFDRTLSIPVEIDSDRVKAEYRNGVLALFLPRAERDKPRSIAID